MKKIILFIFIFVALTSCVTGPLESEEHDRTAKQFATRSDRANIYIYRNKYIGFLSSYPIFINSYGLGLLGHSTYYFLSVKAGSYRIKETFSWPVEYTLNAQAGKNYFVLVDTNVGFFSPNISIKEESESDGKEAILSRSLAARLGHKK